jgi:hypothetical protein
MLNEENAHFVFVDIDFKIDEVSEMRHNQLSDICLKLLMSKPWKLAGVSADLRIACRTALAAAGFRERM